MAEDNIIINALSKTEDNRSNLQKGVCHYFPIPGCVSLKPFYHQRTSTDAADVLRTIWASFTFRTFAFNFFSFACLPNLSLTKKAEGFVVAFARVSPIAKDQVHWPLHLWHTDRGAGRGAGRGSGRGDRHVILYSDFERRAWLVGVCDALLHLARAYSLKKTSQRGFERIWTGCEGDRRPTLLPLL